MDKLNYQVRQFISVHDEIIGTIIAAFYFEEDAEKFCKKQPKTKYRGCKVIKVESREVDNPHPSILTKRY